MSPKTRYAVRSILVGLSAALGSLQGNLPGVSGDDLISAVIAGFIFIVSYAGIGYATPLEPSVGPGK